MIQGDTRNIHFPLSPRIVFVYWCSRKLYTILYKKTDENVLL